VESDGDAARFCVEQYNRVLARLKELDPGVSTLFEPLAAPARSPWWQWHAVSLLLTMRMKSVNLPNGIVRTPRPSTQRDSRFLAQSACDIQDLGEFIRESVGVWARQRQHRQRRISENQEKARK
jgi:hypothetical protein